jgi:NTE family protein
VALKLFERWMHRERTTRPRLGISLGSGAARGVAHVGVIKALEEAGIRIDHIAGTSCGAVVGAIYAGAGLDALLDAAENITLSQLARPTLSKRGLASSIVVETLVQRYLGEKTFRDLNIPLTAVATDLKSGREVLLNTGPVARAARASAGFVGLFAPVEVDGMFLVDGAVSCAAPVGVVRGMGADVVIASDVMPNVVFEDFPEHIFGIVTRTLDILIKKSEVHVLNQADFLVEPIRGDVGSFDLDDPKRLVEMGEVAAKEIIPALRRTLEEQTPAALQLPAAR